MFAKMHFQINFQLKWGDYVKIAKNGHRNIFDVSPN